MKVQSIHGGFVLLDLDLPTIKLVRVIPSKGMRTITKKLNPEEYKALYAIKQLTEMSDQLFEAMAVSQKDDNELPNNPLD